MSEPPYFNDPDALVAATYYCETDIFEKLIAEGADINCTNEYGETPLHAASQEGWDHLVLRLLECGADSNRPNREGDTPWDYAVFYEHLGVKTVLEQHGAIQQSRKSACQLREEQVNQSFSDANAVKRLSSIIEKSKTEDT